MFKEFLKRYRYEILVFFAVLIPRVIYSVIVYAHSGSHGFISYSDAEVFLRQAHNLVEHGVMSRYAELVLLPDPLRTPLYIWFLAAFLWLKASLFGMVTLQNILAALAGVLVYRIGAVHFNAPKAGVVAAALFSVEPMSIYWSNLLMSDNLFAFLIVVTVYLSLERRWYWGAVVLGLATLTRPAGLYYVPVFLFFLAASCLSSSVALPALMKKVLVFVVLFTAVISPWMVRNKLVFGRWGLSTAGWYNLYLFSVSEFAARKNLVMPMPSLPEPYPPGSPAEREYDYRISFEGADFYQTHSRDLIVHYPLEYLVFHIGSGIRSLNNHDYYYLVDHVLRPEIPRVPLGPASFLAHLGQLFWLALYVFAAVGALRGGSVPARIFLLALFVFNNLLIGYNGIISGGGRYNLAFVPLMLLLGTYGAFESYKWMREKIANQKF